ncbi:DUF2867 domain-containing protein [Solitalea longa]|uniref:DUF2867 domain-containing protein n=1 Tax=Solitalea longa TaxID=2079460 RepID=A0A2S4ZXF7_9SPHI|nr:SDR family oxidoreductase [Solitalea longa]POY34995.1 DUF2867 domain-containing protein [Solitalea longa]
MKILLTGTSGYIGKRLLIHLLKENHHIVCSVRDKNRFSSKIYDEAKSNITIIENDFLQLNTLDNIPEDIDAAYFLIHSMASDDGDFAEKEKLAAQNFQSAIEKTECKQVIFLTGIINENKLSKHLESRKQVEATLQSHKYALTVLRAGIIVGSGSASFEIIRDLVEKLPVMIAPVWVKTKCQPIGIRNVIEFLSGVLLKRNVFNRNFDIAGTEVLTYKEMLLQYAEVRHLKRFIITVPFFSPHISSYWLYFITSTSFSLAKNLVNSMKVKVIANKNNLAEDLQITLNTYKENIGFAFDKIKQNEVMSSWYDTFSNNLHQRNVWQYLEVPDEGCFKYKNEMKIIDHETTLNRIFEIGGENGWYYANTLWRIRGYLDRLVGGVGLRRGRRNATELEPGDSLDFWRVLYANRTEKRLLLFAEMKLPGEAWLEFKIQDDKLYQEATFRPVGLWGRFYWYLVYPFHGLIFGGLIRNLVRA